MKSSKKLNDSCFTQSIGFPNLNWEGWLEDRLLEVDVLEIRLDATLLACYVLARFLNYDISTGAKAIPGWNLEDWVRIWSAISSAILLSGFWTLNGVFVTQTLVQTRHPGKVDNINNNNDDDPPGKVDTTFLRTLGNLLLTVPLWLLAEEFFQFAPPGLEVYSLEVYWTTALGLASVLLLVKGSTSGLR